MSGAGTISIGMPVRNEARYLPATLDSLLAQSRPADEIVISDNASTDDTEEVARDYARRFPVIRYHRQPSNIGSASNFRHVLHAATGQYFMWCGGHDLYSPNTLEACAAALDGRPQAVLSAPASCWIDAGDAHLARESGFVDTRGMELIARFVTVLWANMHPVYGLIRRDVLARVPVEGFPGADLAILARLALHGDFLVAPAALWSRREFRTETRYADKLERYSSDEFALVRSRFGRLLPLARLPLELLRTAITAPATVATRALLAGAVLGNLPVRFLSGLRQYR